MVECKYQSSPHLRIRRNTNTSKHHDGNHRDSLELIRWLCLFLIMMDNFNPNRALLNPKFEGYKLHPILQEKAVRRYKLPRRPTQATVSTRSPLSFEEMRSRITHNHLSLDSDSGSAVYVDDQYTICLVSIPMSAVSEFMAILCF